jgi:hypothetical protein
VTSGITRYGCLALVLLAGCSHGPPGRPGPAGTPDPLVLGEFTDDYGSRFTISPRLWLQHPRSRYHIVRWRPDSQYLIARNDPDNPSGGNLWTRIDWMRLPGMAPYAWGFCLSAYQAPNSAAAESSHVAHRETPRTGCNGHPFSRMKPVGAGRSGTGPG